MGKDEGPNVGCTSICGLAPSPGRSARSQEVIGIEKELKRRLEFSGLAGQPLASRGNNAWERGLSPTRLNLFATSLGSNRRNR